MRKTLQKEVGNIWTIYFHQPFMDFNFLASFISQNSTIHDIQCFSLPPLFITKKEVLQNINLAQLIQALCQHGTSTMDRTLIVHCHMAGGQSHVKPICCLVMGDKKKILVHFHNCMGISIFFDCVNYFLITTVCQLLLHDTQFDLIKNDLQSMCKNFASLSYIKILLEFGPA